MLPDRHERLLYVSARGEDDIKVIDLRARRIVDEIPVGDQPETMLLTRNQHTLIVSMRGTPARLAFVDTRTRTVTATLDLAGPATFGDLAAISADDRVVYATFDRGQTGTGGVAVVDIRTPHRHRHLGLPRDRPCPWHRAHIGHPTPAVKRRS